MTNKTDHARDARLPELPPGEWPDFLNIRDTGLNDGYKHIWTTAGMGYPTVKYIRADLARSAVNEDAILPSEAVFAFAAFLTCRDEALTVGSTHNAAPMAEIVRDYCNARGYQKPRVDYHKHPALARQPAPSQPADAVRERHIAVLRAIGSAFKGVPAPCKERDAIKAAVAALAQPAPARTMSPIPNGVCYSAETDNFYDRQTGRGMGTPFYGQWRSRRDEFPRTGAMDPEQHSS